MWAKANASGLGCFFLKERTPQCILALTQTHRLSCHRYLVNEGGKFVVEGLDLLLLILLHPLGIGINLQVEGGQQALVNSHCCDRWGCWDAKSSNSVAKAIAKTTAGSKSQTNTTAGPKAQTSTAPITEAKAHPTASTKANSTADGTRAHSCYPG